MFEISVPISRNDHLFVANAALASVCGFHALRRALDDDSRCGVRAEILFAGSAPEMIGVLQINARIPGGFVAPGETAVALTVRTAKAPPIAIWLK